MLEIILLLIFCALIAAVFFGKSWQKPVSTRADKKTLSGYETRPSIFINSSERAFFQALESHKPHGYRVFCKVRLEDILRVRTDIKDQKTRWQYRGRIKSRHVDFTVCDKAGVFICAVELDGSSHTSKQAHMVDEFKDNIFANAGLKLYRVKTGENFDTVAVALWAEMTCKD